MSTISEKLTQLNTIKGDIKTAINNKGGEVGNDFSTYATAINNLSTGSGGSGEYMHPEFFELRTANNKNYSYLFDKKKISGSLDLSSWNVSGITNMDSFFNMCGNLTSINLSGWVTSKSTSFSNIFYNCNKLVTVIGYLDLSNAKDGFYTASYSHPFYGCNLLETVYLKNIYKDIAITNNVKYSINLKDTKIKDECLIYIINELPDLINDKGLTDTSKIVLTLPPTNTLTQEQVQPAIDKGWQVANVNY